MECLVLYVKGLDQFDSVIKSCMMYWKLVRDEFCHPDMICFQGSVDNETMNRVTIMECDVDMSVLDPAELKILTESVGEHPLSYSVVFSQTEFARDVVTRLVDADFVIVEHDYAGFVRGPELAEQIRNNELVHWYSQYKGGTWDE